MTRTTYLSVFCILAASSADLFAQVKPYEKGFDDPYASTDPWVRRALRDVAEEKVGPKGREFLEAGGDEASAAIGRCSGPVAMGLVAFYASGEMSKLPRPRALLGVIGQRGNGDAVARFAINHAGELADADKFDAFLAEPLAYALDLQQLAVGAAEMQARRRNSAAGAMKWWAGLSDREKVGIVVGVVAVGLLLWRRRGRSGIC